MVVQDPVRHHAPFRNGACGTGRLIRDIAYPLDPDILPT
jgi:hypothetical protein